MKRWFEDESFWEEFRDVLFSEERLERTEYQVDRFEELLGLEKGDKILDQCCGIGRHSIELARRGYEVTGIDLTEAYLEEAREKSEKESLEIELIKADIRDFKREGFYDAVINFFTSFGYSKFEEENRKVLRNSYISLKPGGKILLDVMGKEILENIFTDTDRWRMKDAYFLENRKIRDDLEMLESEWKLIRDDGEVHEHKFMYKLFTKEKLENMLRDIGFDGIKIYGDLEGSGYDDSARRLIAIAEKKDKHEF